MLLSSLKRIIDLKKSQKQNFIAIKLSNIYIYFNVFFNQLNAGWLATTLCIQKATQKRKESFV